MSEERRDDKYDSKRITLMDGYVVGFADLARRYTAARQSGNAGEIAAIHQQAVEYARSHNLHEYALAVLPDGTGMPSVAYKDARMGHIRMGKSEGGEGGAVRSGLVVLKPMMGEGHQVRAELRYGIYQSLMYAPHMKPARHYAPIHDLDNQVSLFVLNLEEGPDIVDVLGKLVEGEEELQRYKRLNAVYGGSEPAKLEQLATVLRAGYLKNGHEGEGLLDTKELSTLEKVLGKINDARGNVIEAALHEDAYWVGFWADKTKDGVVALPNEQSITLDAPDAVRARYVHNLIEIPSRFASQMSTPFAEVEQKAWAESVTRLIGLLDWRKDFVVLSRDAYPRNYRPHLETDNPTFNQLLEFCLSPEKLIQSMKHYDFGTRSSHILEDVFHILATPEAQIKPGDAGKLTRFLGAFAEQLDSYAPKRIAVPFRERVVAPQSKDPNSTGALMMGAYRSARKMELSETYRTDARFMYDHNLLPVNDYDVQLKFFSKMFNDYNGRAVGYFDWMASRLRKSTLGEGGKSEDRRQRKEAFRKYEPLYDRVKMQDLTEQDALEFVTQVLTDPALSERGKLTGCALYAAAFLRKLNKNFPGFRRI
jgi:hypothetical protein